jgi:hypothetical protein
MGEAYINNTLVRRAKFRNLLIGGILRRGYVLMRGLQVNTLKISLVIWV